MKECLEESRCLASLVVFRELYDSRKDVYAIIAEFLNEIIISKGMHQFSVTDITNSLNETYDFCIPEAVIKSSLKRLNYLSKDKGTYIKNPAIEVKRLNIDQKQAEIQKNNDAIFERLFQFIETEKKLILTNEEKVAVVHAFCTFLLDSTSRQNYYEYISAFVIKHKTDSNFVTTLKLIKEGVILYSGIKYTNDLTDFGSWKTDLTIFADTEILFHMAGFNGELNKALFDDFFSFVKEINQKNKRRVIHIKYFREVKVEIENFFKKAEFIVAGSSIINPKGTAMSYIVNGCISASDVICKKANFFQLVTTNGIMEDDYQDYYEEKNHRYNIVDKSVVENVSKSTRIEDITEHLTYLNYVNIRRGGSNAINFENISYILLTGNFKTIQVAWHDDVKSLTSVPLATTLEFLTNKFWYKLNKGFGNVNYPKSFDVITRAQILLSSQLNDSVVKKYEELKEQFEQGKLTEIQAIATIVELRKLTKKPEEIGLDDIESILETLTEGSIERYIKEQDYLKAKVAKEAEENERLRLDLALKELEIQQNKKLESSLVLSTIEMKEKILQEHILSIQDLERHKVPLDRLAKKDYVILITIISFFVIMHYSLLFYLIYKLSWSVMEPWTYICGSLPIIFCVFYLIVYENEFNPLNFLKKKKQQYYDRRYDKFGFDTSRLSELYEKKNVLRQEIEGLMENEIAQRALPSISNVDTQ